jgi:N-acetylmuramic acid 6-phosphate etherase
MRSIFGIVNDSDKITEKDSLYQGLEKMSTEELLRSMNAEDQKVPQLIGKEIDSIGRLVDAAYNRLKTGGRLFYLGAGTSGRLGIVDASECPPTFGIEHGRVIGLIAGGDNAIRKAVEFAEDNWEAGWRDLRSHDISSADFVVGLAASGTTPYVLGALQHCREAGVATGCITCNPGSPLALLAEFPVVVVTGPEFVTGSTRMKAGTAQKLVLNMISTSVMIRLGRVKGNKMVDMQLSNEKLVERGTKMIMDELGLDEAQARELLLLKGSVREALRGSKETD